MIRKAREGIRLSPRQREIARLVALGLADKEIADRLGIAVNTVKNHLRVTYARCAIGNRVKLTRLHLLGRLSL